MVFGGVRQSPHWAKREVAGAPGWLCLLELLKPKTVLCPLTQPVSMNPMSGPTHGGGDQGSGWPGLQSVLEAVLVVVAQSESFARRILPLMLTPHRLSQRGNATSAKEERMSKNGGTSNAKWMEIAKHGGCSGGKTVSIISTSVTTSWAAMGQIWDQNRCPQPRGCSASTENVYNPENQRCLDRTFT